MTKNSATSDAFSGRSQTAITAVGPPGASEAGTVVDYFLERKSGTPAPVRVFFPKESGRPTIAYMGSL